MNPGGTDIMNIKEKANIIEDNISKRKHNHSMAPAMLNLAILRVEALHYTPHLGVRVPFAGTSPPPLGQSLRIIERSREKESEQSRSRKNEQFSQSKHQKAGKPRQPAGGHPIESRKEPRLVLDLGIAKLHNMDHHQQDNLFKLSTTYSGGQYNTSVPKIHKTLRKNFMPTADAVHNRARLCRTKKGTFRQHLILINNIKASKQDMYKRFQIIKKPLSPATTADRSVQPPYHSQAFGHSALQVLGHQASQLFFHSASRVFYRLASLPFGLIDFVYWKFSRNSWELLGHGRSILSTGKFSRNSWVTDDHSRLLGCSPGTPGSRTTIHELLGHGRPISSTGKFSRNSWATDDQSFLLGDSPGTPGPQTTVLVYREILQELLGHERSITSTGRFFRNFWATDDQFCLLGSSPGTPGSRTTNHVYWEVLQELLGHGRSILSTGMFSRNSWVTDNQSRLLGGSPGTLGPRTVNFVYWMFSRNSWVTDNQSHLLGGSPGTPGPWTVNFVYWEVLQELLGHGQPFMPTGRSTDEQHLEARSPTQVPFAGTSPPSPPLGQSLRIIERSREKESERSRSRKNEQSSQSKHQKAGKPRQPDITAIILRSCIIMKENDASDTDDRRDSARSRRSGVTFRKKNLEEFIIMPAQDSIAFSMLFEMLGRNGRYDQSVDSLAFGNDAHDTLSCPHDCLVITGSSHQDDRPFSVSRGRSNMFLVGRAAATRPSAPGEHEHSPMEHVPNRPRRPARSSAPWEHEHSPMEHVPNRPRRPARPSAPWEHEHSPMEHVPNRPRLRRRASISVKPQGYDNTDSLGESDPAGNDRPDHGSLLTLTQSRAISRYPTGRCLRGEQDKQARGRVRRTDGITQEIIHPIIDVLRDGQINEGIESVAVATACVQFKPLSCIATLNIDGMWGQNTAKENFQNP
ncbi:hypothetical protein V8G54_013565 [Vigna mungo]|uniref:Uncharacterized protein n=1 Tax=Vigna mungo TaxID=3915 RepID=A0AAQ3S1N6_VIGMU